MNRIAILFLLLFSANCIEAQKIQVQQVKGVIQFSSNGKSGWTSCALNKDISGYLKLEDGASMIFGANGKSMFWKKKGIYKTSELEKQLVGFNNDAAHVLWEQVTHHKEPKRNAIGGVSRGNGKPYGGLRDSSFVPVNVFVPIHFENPNALNYYFRLQAKTGKSQLDTLLATRRDYINFKFSEEGVYEWRLQTNDLEDKSSKQVLLVISYKDYRVKLERFESFKSALSDTDEELKQELIEFYLEVFKLGYFPQ
ncbi:MAG: hypothetical protein RLZZ71_1598 [Bacteroidota bacterium]|jgi:hypothetical protein